MSVQQDISGLSGDDLLFSVSLTYNGAPLNLGTITSVTAYLKASQTASDTTAKLYTVNSGLTVTNSAQGQLNWAVPNGDVPGNNWYKFRVVDGSGKISTALYGRLDPMPV